MKIAGIIAEYNPFHAGHAYQILQTSKLYDVDAVICVMSGHFVQRGEAAIFDKWTRAHAAVLGGADIVIELPFFYATQSAEAFAHGAVMMLDALQCVSVLSFGTETHDLHALEQIAQILSDEPVAYTGILHQKLGEGLSYPAARAAALEIYEPGFDRTLYSSSNNILGIEYIKALIRINSNISPANIVRQGSRYTDHELCAQYSSATAIRHSLLQHGLHHLKESDIPPFVRSLYTNEPVAAESAFPYILFCLRNMDIKELSEIFEISEGLEYKLQRAAYTAKTYSELISLTKSKRYTQTRIQRILLYAMMGLTKKKAQLLRESSIYAHVLAVKKERIDLLGELKAKSSVPIVTKASEFPDNPLFDLDVKASDTYALLHKKIAPARRDFTQKFLIV